MKRVVVAVVVLLAAVVPASAVARTSVDVNGTLLVDGVRAFPIGLSKPPELGVRTPAGGDGLTEVAAAGIGLFKVGPVGHAWGDADIADAQLWNQAAAARGAKTWVTLNELGRAQPGTAQEAMLRKVVSTLKGDSGLGMWKSVDEPWWGHVPASDLQFAYCMATARGNDSWCDKPQSIDPSHSWVTIEAPRGTAADLVPYSAVTDVHGFDVYPVTLNNTSPDLHQVGTWAQTLSSITPNHSVWATLQICASGSADPSGHFVLPTKRQERYMIYDAIVNGARAISFYGGNNPKCWGSSDSQFGWNWTFWNTVLKSLILEVGPKSALYPALLNAGTNRDLATSDPGTQVISRQVGARDLWVIAARSGTGTRSVSISGLPPTVRTGSAYTEGRYVYPRNGSLADTFAQWSVHVYHLRSYTEL